MSLGIKNFSDKYNEQPFLEGVDLFLGLHFKSSSTFCPKTKSWKQYWRDVVNSDLKLPTDACVLFSMAESLVFKRMRNFNRTTDWKIPVLRIFVILPF